MAFGLIVHEQDWTDIKDLLQDGEAMMVLSALANYAFNGVVPTEDGMPKVVVAILRKMIRRYNSDRDSYERRTNASRENGSKGGRPRKTLPEIEASNTQQEAAENLKNPQVIQVTTENPENPYISLSTNTKQNTNTICTVQYPIKEECISYFTSHGGFTDQGERFYDTYAPRGWTDSHGGKVNNWQRMADTWISRDQHKAIIKKPLETQYEQREYEATTTLPDWMRDLLVSIQEQVQNPDPKNVA